MRKARITMGMVGCLALVLLIFSCNHKRQSQYQKLMGFTQGTDFSITYYHPKGINFSSQIDSILNEIDLSMSVYNPNSVISAFNRSEKGMELDSLLADVVSQSLIYSQETDGAFDITVGPLVRAWGFMESETDMPTQEQVDDLLTIIGSDKIWLEGNFLFKSNPRVTIDVNAIAQGYTVDVIGGFLERQGATDFLVEVGGEILTKGNNPRRSRWIVGLDKPVDGALPGEALQAKIAITNRALVTSGNYRKFVVRNGIKYGHSINPQTGYPANNTMLSATVVDETGARTDALATAFMVMGLEKSKDWLKKNRGVEAYLIHSGSKGEFKVWMTSGMREMLAD